MDYQNALKNHVLTSPYGTLSDAIDAHQYDKNICHTYECDACNGHGRVNCSSCHGSGKEQCNTCESTAYITEVSTIYTVVLHMHEQYSDILAMQFAYSAKVFAFSDHAFKGFSVFFDNIVGMSKYIGLKLLITFYIIFFIRRFWLRAWLKRAGQVRFYRWSLYFGFAVRHRLMPAIVAVLLTFASIYFAPLTLDVSNKVWGLIPAEIILDYSLKIQQWLSYLNYLKFF